MHQDSPCCLRSQTERTSRMETCGKNRSNTKTHDGSMGQRFIYHALVIHICLIFMIHCWESKYTIPMGIPWIIQENFMWLCLIGETKVATNLLIQHRSQGTKILGGTVEDDCRDLLCFFYTLVSVRSKKRFKAFVHSKSLDINLKLKCFKMFQYYVVFGVHPYLLSLFMCMSVHSYSRF